MSGFLQAHLLVVGASVSISSLAGFLTLDRIASNWKHFRKFSTQVFHQPQRTCCSQKNNNTPLSTTSISCSSSCNSTSCQKGSCQCCSSSSSTTTSTSKNSLVLRQIVALSKPTGPIFRVVHWNMLADIYSHNDEKGFPHADPEVLKWSFRFPNILAELRHWGGDIICAQEVDHYEELLSELKSLNFSGIYYKAVDDVQGIALFYNKNKFKLLDHTIVQYTVSNKQGAIIGRLLNYETKRQVLVACTHLKAKAEPGFDIKRLSQIQQLIQRLSKLHAHYLTYSPSTSSSSEPKPSPPQLPIIITGDFNDVPNSPAYQFVKTGFYEKTTRTPETKHSFHFSSIFNDSEDLSDKKTIIQQQEEVEEEYWTTFKKRKEITRRIIDYIWYTQNNVKLRSRNEKPKLNDYPNLLPSTQYPSDHIALVADFEFI